MTSTERTVSTRHLVDPETLPLLDAFQPIEFTVAALPAIREGMNAPQPGAPDPAELYPGVTRTELSIPGLDGDPDVGILLYEPAERATAAPAMVWIHGGGFIIGTAANDDLVCRRMAAQAGCVVASVDYRLAPETPAPGSVHDCYAALRWVHENAGSLGVDTARVAIGGASAGGGLAACLAILARDRGDLQVSFQLLIYPMLDDRTASTVDPSPYVGEFIWSPASNRFGWASLLGREPGGAEVSPYASAARVESVAGLPPTYISVGSLDLFAEEDIEYARRLLRVGIPTELHVYPGGYHGFNMAPDARITLAYFRDMTGALDRHFNG
ncbi:MAG TPA: alpha/beta hydrolase [Trebonia sp.]|jgi:triacylglycerol lipase|nr:alpha/beta hydrolase [Trebonia sp.]